MCHKKTNKLTNQIYLFNHSANKRILLFKNKKEIKYVADKLIISLIFYFPLEENKHHYSIY